MHTLGPWQTTIARNGHVSIYPVGGKERVADVYCPLDRDTDDSVDGNARLIAAAPALLEALQECLPDLVHYVAAHGPGPDKRLEAARAAIARATQGGD